MSETTKLDLNIQWSNEHGYIVHPSSTANVLRATNTLDKQQESLPVKEELKRGNSTLRYVASKILNLNVGNSADETKFWQTFQQLRFGFKKIIIPPTNKDEKAKRSTIISTIMSPVTPREDIALLENVIRKSGGTPMKILNSDLGPTSPYSLPSTTGYEKPIDLEKWERRNRKLRR